MIEINDFKRYLSLVDVANIKGRGTELITFFIPSSIALHEVLNKIKFEKNECRNIKSKQTKKALESSLSTIAGYLEKEGIPTCESLILLSGLVKDELYFKTFTTTTILPYKYYCSDTFYTEGYFEGLVQTNYYLIVLDLNGATVGLKSTNGIEVLKNFDSYIPSKTKKGGQSSKRYAEIRHNETRELYGRVASYCRDIDLASPKPFLLGGSPPTIDNFLKDKHLPESIKKKTSGPYYLQTDNEAGLEELVAFSKTDELERERETQQLFLAKKSYSPNSFTELKNLLWLVPFSLLKNPLELEILNKAHEDCKVLIIQDYTSLGAEFNNANKLRVIPI